MNHKRDVYPIFLPHAGCPFQCVYCNQHAVASPGRPGLGIFEKVESSLQGYAEHIHRSNRPGEIAFYGGTFTALPVRLVERILQAAASYIERGLFTGIRFSTRPDCLGGDIVRLLSKYPVSTVELGVQSLSDKVLAESGRGYSARQAHEAAECVRERKWTLGIQLMAGLPGDSPGFFLKSVLGAISMGADFFRFYPTLVLEGTRLAQSFRRGEYLPLSLDEAVSWIVAGYNLALDAGIPVVRMGLHSDPVLEKPGTILAGPYHPAFGYLVRCRWWRDRVDEELAALSGVAGSELHLCVPENKISDATGEKRCNLEHWRTRWAIKSLRICGEPALTGVEMFIRNCHST